MCVVHKKSLMLGAALLVLAPSQLLIAVGENRNKENLEFFTSFRQPERQYLDLFTEPAKSTRSTGNYFFTNKPFLGHYQNSGTQARATDPTRGDEYNPRTRLAIIEFPATHLPQIALPLWQLLEKEGVRTEDMEFDIALYGDFQLATQAPYGFEANTVNVTFHSIINYWRNVGYSYFVTPVKSGLFFGKGVKPAEGPEFDQPLAFSKLEPRSVSFHPTGKPYSALAAVPDAYSPNNQRFVIDPTHGVSTFWIVGVYDPATDRPGGEKNDKPTSCRVKKASITFNIVINNAEFERQLTASILATNFPPANYNALITLLEITPSTLTAEPLDKESQEALGVATAIMKEALNQNPEIVKAEEERERALAEKARQDKAKADEVIRLKQQAEAQASAAASAAAKKKAIPAWQKPLLNAITKTQKDLDRAQKPIKDAQTKLARAQRQAQQAQRAFNEAKRKKAPAKQLKQAQNKLQAAIKARDAAKNALTKLTKNTKLMKNIQTAKKKYTDAKKRLATEIKKRTPKK